MPISPQYALQAKNPQKAKTTADVQGKQPRSMKGVLGSAFGYGMIGVDAYMRVKNGESMLPAVGKALVTNALWAMAPGGWGAALGLGFLESAPQLANIVDAKASMLGAKVQMFGGGYTQNEGQEWMKNESMMNMVQARNTGAAIMANHARSARKLY